ncbi:MAG: hypothetical protein JNJ60_04770 [Rhodocyclaceae bacterium]|nr:hypothetical protein [Rhodocyclaceae bacterium]
MPGPITYAAVALLARDRLARMQAMLRSKIELRPNATDLERQVAYLAEKAVATMNAAQPTVAPPVRLYGPPQGDQVSKFLFMGAVGPEFTAFAAQFAPLQRWLRDTLHKGTPDENYEQVLSYCSDFALTFWRQVGPAITREIADANKRNEALAQMQAYVLGHCCHIATDVISSPYVDALEARLGDATRPRLNRTQVISAIETEVLNLMFAPTAPATGHEVDTWWPEPALVPKPFYTAFREALEAVYGAGANKEGGAPYEAMRNQHAPPALSSELLEDGYRSFRMALGMGSTWTLGEWLGFTSFMYLPALVALPIASKLPQGKDAFRDTKPPGHDGDAALFEAINLPFALGSIIPLAYTFAMNLSSLGAEGPVIFGWVSAAAQVICAIIFFATLGKGGVPKWLLLFALPLAIEIAFVVFTLTQVNQDNPKRWLLALSGLSHLGLGAIFALLYAAFLHRAPEALNDDDGGAFAGWFILWFFILGGFWVGTAFMMRYLAVPIPARPGGTLPTGLTALPGGTTTAAIVQPAAVQLIDETMLSFAGPVDDSTSPAARYYPTDRRPLLKLWWTGGGSPTVRAAHDRIEFKFGATTRTVFAPAVPMTLGDFMTYLKALVKDGGGQAKLETKLFFADQSAHEVALLPPGLAFSDAGDDKDTVADHDAAVAAAPAALGDSEKTAFVLFASPRRVKAVLADRAGPVTGTRDPAVLTAGSGVLSVDPTNARVLTIPAGSATRFTAFLEPGDSIEADLAPPPAGNLARRVIVSVDSDTRITISTPLPAAPTGTWRRVVRQQTGLEATPAGWLAQVVGGQALQHNLLQGSGGATFGAFFAPGDTIRLQPGGTFQDRIVTEVISDTQIRINARLDPPLNVAPLPTVPFARVASPSARLYGYLAANDDTLFTGQALMNEAADFATLLCLGAMSHLLPDADRDKSKFGGTTSINRAYQVFRNWNLDRRRENEWRMLVLGGAVDEKAGAPASADFAMGATPAGYTAAAPDGDATLRRLGWIPTLRGWMDMSSRGANDAAGAAAFRPELPANAKLSRAMAFLLDQTAPPLPPA